MAAAANPVKVAVDKAPKDRTKEDLMLLTNDLAMSDAAHDFGKGARGDEEGKVGAALKRAIQKILGGTELSFDELFK